MTTHYTIEIDCAPGNPRPGDYLPFILEGTGVELDPENPAMKLFGCWTWIIPESQESNYEQHRDLIKARIQELYHSGKIRYGSW